MNEGAKKRNFLYQYFVSEIKKVFENKKMGKFF